MKGFLKFIGIILIFIGAIELIFITVSDTTTNTGLAIGGALIIVGLFSHILINKYVE